MYSDMAINKLREFVRYESKLNSLLYLKLFFKPLDGLGTLHIAMERRSAYIPVFRVNNTIYIPTSSIIGALRSIAETIVKSSINVFKDPIERMLVEAHCEPEADTIRHICSPLGDTYIDFVKDLTMRLAADKSLYKYFMTDDAMEEVREVVKTLKELDKIPRALETILSALCPICRLFGGPGLESKISVLKVKPKISGIHNMTHVSISRQTSTSIPRHIYTREYIVISMLSIDILVKNLKLGSSELKILKGLLNYLAKIGISIGGAKSIGTGKFFLDQDNSEGIYVDLSSINDRIHLINALINIESLTRKSLSELLKEIT